ncbi:MAG TPA: hypothetical protein RMH99_23925 [Sandaracinaceae bacterium LLY-WYZ-13_1]|nr:hypothetical protein [Sandaracinaceae bacterium LLY-WYZ-13_1]
MSRRDAILALALALLACSEADEGPSPALEADVERLRMVMIQDSAQQPLAEVERVVDDRPVLAGRLLRSGGIPAAERQVRAAERVEVRTDEGRQLRGRMVTAYRARVSALRDYADVLDAQARDDAALLEALRAQSDADMLLLDLDRDLEAIVPTGPRPRPGGGAPEGEASDAPEDTEDDGEGAGPAVDRPPPAR